ncbi:hypothetical protein ABZX95_45380 [Streptomyces sp. NPDC004232]|uniref:hypothetical protein n=1 Tax=Streptomyces sp. NPDC004232 TaxID=3154454 RepID=UPI0033BD482E
MVDWQRLSWTRWVVALNEPAVLDRHGWPVVLAYAGGGAGRPVSALRDLALLVLRAEWGTGKSIAFEQEHAALRSVGVSAELVDLGKCGTDVRRTEHAVDDHVTFWASTGLAAVT